MKPPFIADEPMGFCGGCGIQISEGDWVAIRENVACHATTCTPRHRAEPTPEQPSMLLFADPQLEVIEQTKSAIGASRIAFDGESARPVDVARLAGQLQKVFELMKDQKFRSLEQIAAATDCLETSASARLRDFRKARNGSHTVLVRYDQRTKENEYALILNETGKAKREQRAA